MHSREATLTRIISNQTQNQVNFSQKMCNWLIKDYQEQVLIPNPIYSSLKTDSQNDYLPVNLIATQTDNSEKQLINPREIFHFPQQKVNGEIIPKQLLVFGGAGSGKSMLSQLLTKEWANHNSGILRDQFEWVFLIPLRKLAHYSPEQIKKLGLQGILYQESFRKYFGNDPEQPRDYQIWWDRLNRNKALFIFDGFDELLPNLTLETLNLIRSDAQHFLLSSRPTTQYLLEKEFQPSALSDKKVFLRHLNILGLEPQQIELYIKRFGKKLSQNHLTTLPNQHLELITYLKKHPVLWDLAANPRTLELICGVWYKTIENGHTIEFSTTTQVYQQIIDLLSSDTNKTALINCLETIAINAGSKTIFNYADLDQFANNSGITFSELLNSGLIMAMTNSDTPAQAEYCFLNLSLQEFFQARFLLNNFDSNSNEAHHFKENMFHERYEQVRLFLAGLLSQQNHLDEYFNLMLEYHKNDLLSLRSLLSIVNCLNENFASVNQEQKINILTQLKKWILASFELGDFEKSIPEVKNRLINCLRKNTSVFSSDVISEIFITALKNSDNPIQLSALAVLAKTGSPHPAMTGELLSILQADPTTDAKIFILNALGQNPHSNERIIQQLICATQDEATSVKVAAMQAINALGLTVGDETLEECLIKALDNSNEDLRFNALQSIEHLHVKSPTMLNACKKLVQDDFTNISSLARDILSKYDEFDLFVLKSLMSNKPKKSLSNRSACIIKDDPDDDEEYSESLYKFAKANFLRDPIEFVQTILTKGQNISSQRYALLTKALARVARENLDSFDCLLSALQNENKTVMPFIIDGLGFLIDAEDFDTSNESRTKLKQAFCHLLTSSNNLDEVCLPIIHALSKSDNDAQIIHALLSTMIGNNPKLAQPAAKALSQHNLAGYLTFINYEDLPEKSILTTALQSTPLVSMLANYEQSPNDNMLKLICHKGLTINAAFIAKADKLTIVDSIQSTDFIFKSPDNMTTFISDQQRVFESMTQKPTSQISPEYQYRKMR